MTESCACADCGGVVDEAHLSWYACGRPLCPSCLRDELDTPKKDAEIWILERMYGSSASAGAKDAA